jgi:hypothetical protein
MRRRLIFGFPFGGRLELLLVAGAAYFAWQHEQGKHAQVQILCPICLLNKIAPASEPAGGAPAGGAAPSDAPPTDAAPSDAPPSEAPPSEAPPSDAPPTPEQ